MPITAIGETLGFSESGGFSRHFFAWAGISPSAYRAMYMADAAKVAAATALLNERRIS
jgi:AraC-like DNA-binding protein